MCVTKRANAATPPAVIASTALPKLQQYYDEAAQNVSEEERPDMIDVLNAHVAKQAQKNWQPEDEEYKVYELVREGHTVFKKRSYALLYFYWVVIAIGLLRGPSIPFVLGAFLSAYVYMELYSAVLHIVLDNPAFLRIPGLDEPCLEFQMHHFIPHEITVRRYRDIAGDLNTIVGVIFLIQTYIYGGLKDGRVMCVLAAGGAMAYVGQLAHRQAHMLPSKVSPYVRPFQEMGLLVNPALHRAHHRTYTQGFAILGGWSEPLVTFLFNKVVPSQFIWLALFLVMTIVGMTGMVEAYLHTYDAIAARVLA
jgi:hypothetical protein